MFDNIGGVTALIVIPWLQSLKPKALSPILVTPLPIVTLVRPLQVSKAPLPILVTLLGMSKLIRD